MTFELSVFFVLLRVYVDYINHVCHVAMLCEQAPSITTRPTSHSDIHAKCLLLDAESMALLTKKGLSRYDNDLLLALRSALFL